jgi:hypothetical protein
MSLFDTGARGTAITLTQLLGVEDSPGLLALTCPRTSIPVWSVLRIAFLREIMGDLLFASGTLAPPSQSRYVKAAAVLGRTVLHNARVAAGDHLRADVLINSDSIGDTLREGRWFNRHADPFGDLPMAQAVVLSDLHEWQIHMPRHNERVFYHAPVQVAAALIGRMPNRAAQDLAKAATAIVCDRAREILDWQMPEHRRRAFECWAASKVAGLPFRYNAYRRLLHRVRPKLILVLAGCYGAHAPLIAAAHDARIMTGEFQHGSISAGHDAYNFAPSIFASEAYRRTLPRYLLTYGSWWSSQVTAPVECVVVGNPIRSQKMAAIPPPDAHRRQILVLSDGIEFDLYLELAQSIAKAVTGRGLEVVLRPHPLERDSVTHRYLERVGDVKIDVTPDIYQSFASAHTVVSEVSTGLFEAVGLVNRIVLLDTAKARFAYPDPPFVAANSIDDVIEQICGLAPPVPRIDAASLWAPDWPENYAWFLRHKAGIGV